MPLQEMVELRRFITVAHHVPGRIRLKIDPAVRSHPKAMALAALAEKGDGAIRAQLNVLARSLVLEYDPDRIDPRRLEDFFTVADPQEAAGLAKDLSGAFGLTPNA
ncbi:heavy-metal-associated domain-containing protein [Desulfolutivibrio sp.]|uniref:heavy-metal-associated domain-containing protein n=1 Tax=Desulfolutivibrio sp. TaxID=2773296 RepID=UPI002F9636FD